MLVMGILPTILTKEAHVMCTDSDAATQRSLSTLIAEADQFLRQQPYYPQTVRRIQRTWQKLLHSPQADAAGGLYSLELMQRFMREQLSYPFTDDMYPLSSALTQQVRALRMLIDFAFHGRWTFRSNSTNTMLSPEHQLIWEAYMEDWARHGAAASTIQACHGRVRKFFLFLDSKQLNYRQVTPAVLSAYLATQLEMSQNTLQHDAYYLRRLMRFFYERGDVPTDWSDAVPQVRGVRNRRIPAIWRPEDVTRMLAMVDRGSPAGKRDYAMLLLVTRLGLRNRDLLRLQLEHFHWEERQLVFSQSKTGQVVSLPLVDEVARAVIDYLQHGRPRTEARQLFVQHRAPFAPFGPYTNCYHMLNRYRRQAGIAVPAEHRHGLHSLRHTLASTLLAQHTPLNTISAILGHLDSRSTQTYLKVDLEQLRQCALDPEEVQHVRE